LRYGLFDHAKRAFSPSQTVRFASPKSPFCNAFVYGRLAKRFRSDARIVHFAGFINAQVKLGKGILKAQNGLIQNAK